MNAAISLTDLIAGFHRAAENLIREKDQLNRLNYFPIADRDTGTNMSVSFRKALQLVHEPATCKDFGEQFSMALLETGHGNSGTILTLYFEGFASCLPDDDVLDASSFASALKSGYAAAYDAVSNPREGTILTIMRQAAEAAVSFASIDGSTVSVLHRCCTEAHAALKHTPVLNPAHATDSGAYGFCLFLDGLLEDDIPPYAPFQTDGEVLEEIPYRYCTEGLVDLTSYGEADPACAISALKARLTLLGDCFLLVPTGQHAKFHIHTADPDQVFSIAAEYGQVISRKVDDMLASVFT